MPPWITVLSRHTVFTERVIYYKFTLVWYSTKQGTLHRPMSHLVHLHTLPFLWLREEHRRLCSWVDDFPGQCLLWQLLLRFAAAAVVPLLLLPPPGNLSTWFQVGVSNQNFTDGFLPEFYYLFIFLFFFFCHCSICLVKLLCMTWHSCRNVIPVRYECLLQWQQDRSKATMWLLYNIPAIRGCPRHCH